MQICFKPRTFLSFTKFINITTLIQGLQIDNPSIRNCYHAKLLTVLILKLILLKATICGKSKPANHFLGDSIRICDCILCLFAQPLNCCFVTFYYCALTLLLSSDVYFTKAMIVSLIYSEIFQEYNRSQLFETTNFVL